MVVWETAVSVARRYSIAPPAALEVVRDYLALAGIQTLSVPPEAADLAIDAFDRYGKGRHPAALNFGDCFSYACARCYRQPLLYKGDDFPRTDIEAA